MKEDKMELKIEGNKFYMLEAKQDKRIYMNDYRRPKDAKRILKKGWKRWR